METTQIFRGIGNPDWIPNEILYNHTTCRLATDVSDDTLPSIPLGEDKLVLHGRYRDGQGFICEMVSVVDSGSQAHYLGYRFRSNRHILYRENGSTNAAGFPVSDDIVDRIL